MPAAVVAEQVAETCRAETAIRKQEGSTGPADSAEHKAPINPVSEPSEPARTSTPRAYLIGGKNDQ